MVIDVDDELLKKAKKLSGVRKNADVVKLALECFIRQKSVEKIMELKGKIHWDGDLDEMRKDRRFTCR